MEAEIATISAELVAQAKEAADRSEEHGGEGGSDGRRNAESDTTCYTLGRWRLTGDVRETRGSETWDESVRLTA